MKIGPPRDYILLLVFVALFGLAGLFMIKELLFRGSIAFNPFIIAYIFYMGAKITKIGLSKYEITDWTLEIYQRDLKGNRVHRTIDIEVLSVQHTSRLMLPLFKQFYTVQIRKENSDDLIILKGIPSDTDVNDLIRKVQKNLWKRDDKV
ncbi:MAG: hypothetical protein LIP03_05395 [Bacteroidales bacterium]|nr:hypothetical protein [Bacteroidales bacterium]